MNYVKGNEIDRRLGERVKVKGGVVGGREGPIYKSQDGPCQEEVCGQEFRALHLCMGPNCFLRMWGIKPLRRSQVGDE